VTRRRGRRRRTARTGCPAPRPCVRARPTARRAASRTCAAPVRGSEGRRTTLGRPSRHARQRRQRSTRLRANISSRTAG